MRDATVSRLGWGAILLGLASILILGISAYGYRTDWWPVVRALDVATWSAWAAVAGTFTALVAIALWLRRKRGGGGMALLGLVLSLPILTVAAWEYATFTTPPINDISTDTEDPPVFWYTDAPTCDYMG